MARITPKPGGLYSMTPAGLGRSMGLGSGFVALLRYFCVHAGSFSFGGVVLGDLVHNNLHGPDLPWYVWRAVFWLGTAVLGYLKVELSAKVLTVFLLCELAIVICYNVFEFVKGGADHTGISMSMARRSSQCLARGTRIRRSGSRMTMHPPGCGVRLPKSGANDLRVRLWAHSGTKRPAAKGAGMTVEIDFWSNGADPFDIPWGQYVFHIHAGPKPGQPGTAPTSLPSTAGPVQAAPASGPQQPVITVPAWPDLTPPLMLDKLLGPDDISEWLDNIKITGNQSLQLRFDTPSGAEGFDLKTVVDGLDEHSRKIAKLDVVGWANDIDG
ncbi:APC family permease [Kribbella capetownensis]|uniref:APC family permease n=1 Tax=Kribbella capetownensis TaxID=1572659 RepID=A0A4R0IKC1_9ACTN|nr:APC family permease [Kribbella capetownensis]TCC32644.1 APC family permease [Kribbella capetownensis]